MAAGGVASLDSAGFYAHALQNATGNATAAAATAAAAAATAAAATAAAAAAAAGTLTSMTSQPPELSRSADVFHSQRMVLLQALVEMTTAGALNVSTAALAPGGWALDPGCINGTVTGLDTGATGAGNGSGVGGGGVISGVGGFNCSTLTSAGAGDPAFHDFYKMAQFVTGLICYPIICAYGMLGNIFILIVLAQKSMHTSTNVYLSALAVSDTIKLVNDSLYFLTILLFETDPAAGNKAFGYLYPYAHFIFNMSVCVSSWLTVSVAVERYILVCHPLKSKTLTTIVRAKWISSVCFLVMTAVAVPSALRYKTVEEVVLEKGVNKTKLDVRLTALWKDETFVIAYNWLQSLLRSIIPLFVLIVMNGFIINALRQTRANKKMASKNKITIMLCIMIVFFLVCIIPDAVMSAFFNLGYVESDNYLVKGMREITDMLLAVNAAMNFILYMIFNKIFRDQFLGVFCDRCGKCDKDKEQQDAQYRRLTDGKAAGKAGRAGGGKAQTNGVKNCKNVESSKV